MSCQLELTVTTITENTDLQADVSEDCEIVIEITDSPPPPWAGIDDNAGIGQTGVSWSADKLSQESAAVLQAIEDKVDKESGHSLLPDTEIARLAAMADGATKNRDDSENADELHTHGINDVTGLSDRLDSIDALIGDVESALIIINGEP